MSNSTKPLDTDAKSLLDEILPEVEISLDGDAEVKKEAAVEIEKVGDMTKAQALAFMEEKVLIVIAEPTDDTAPRLVSLSVNGKSQYLLPGEPTEVRRKYIEILARARQTRYKQVVKRNELTGEPVNKMLPRQVLRHNFNVIHDPNPLGREWLINLMKSPV